MEAAMRNLTDHAPRQNRVTAVYEDKISSFALKKGATLSDLAEHLAQIEARSGRKPIAVGVKFDA
jgi:hypothetical protein